MSPAPATIPPPPAPPEFLPPERAWTRALGQLNRFDQVFVADNAAFGRYEAGVLHVTVRKEMWRTRVFDALRVLDFGTLFEGFIRLEVGVGQAGETGRERWAVVTTEAREQARQDAERSPAIRRLRELFGADLESVEPILDGVRDTTLGVEEMHDE